MPVNLRQELSRQRELFTRGHITQAEYEQAFLSIDRQLQKLKPSAQPEAHAILPLLKDFPAPWRLPILARKCTSDSRQRCTTFLVDASWKSAVSKATWIEIF